MQIEYAFRHARTDQERVVVDDKYCGYRYDSEKSL